MRSCETFLPISWSPGLPSCPPVPQEEISDGAASELEPFLQVRSGGWSTASINPQSCRPFHRQRLPPKIRPRRHPLPRDTQKYSLPSDLGVERIVSERLNILVTSQRVHGKTAEIPRAVHHRPRPHSFMRPPGGRCTKCENEAPHRRLRVQSTKAKVQRQSPSTQIPKSSSVVPGLG